MTMEAQLPLDPHRLFSTAARKFESVRDWLCAPAQASAPHEVVESRLLVEARELGRLLVQAHMDLRTEREKLLAAPIAAPVDAHRRVITRTLRTVLGVVRVARVAWQARGRVTVIPLDQTLGMPVAQYSLGVQRFVAEQVETMSYDRSGSALKSMGIAVPKRQREEILVRMTEDFEAFYTDRPQPSNDTLTSQTPLLMSADSVGVKVLRASLREATRKAAEAAAASVIRGDPMASRTGHTHDCRMAVVTMNWDQERRPREAADILEQLKPVGQRTRAAITLPRPANRRVRASLNRPQAEAIEEMFDEAERRDPRHERPWVVLLDGSESQRDQVMREAERRGVWVQLVLDLIHVLHYLWQAAIVLHEGTNAEAEQWVTTNLERLLTRAPDIFVAGLRQSATRRGLEGKAAEAVERCAKYLEDNRLGADYPRFLREGYPIATGNIEGACRHLVRDRMDITGARWSTEGAEAVLKTRALMKSGDWDEYCLFHARKVHARTYFPAKVAA